MESGFENISDRLNYWGQTQPLIKSIYVFGSRVSNSYRDDSDLDIAVELQETKEEPQTVWMDHSEGWRNELSNIFPWEIDLEWLTSDDTHIRSYVDEKGVCVYQQVKSS